MCLLSQWIQNVEVLSKTIIHRNVIGSHNGMLSGSEDAMILYLENTNNLPKPVKIYTSTEEDSQLQTSS